MSAPRAELLRLLEECKQHPEEDAARLVLADWLEEHGDEDDRERSAFVRFQLSACPEKLGTAFTLWRDSRWERSVRRWAPSHSSRRPASSYRGLVHVSLDPKLAAGPRAEATARGEPWAWVEGVSINGTRTPLPTLLSSPLLDTVASVHISRVALEAEALAVRFRPAWRALDLGSVSLGAGGLAPLLRSPATAGLRDLSLCSTSSDRRDVAALADSLPALERLTLPGTEGWGEMLARAGWQLRSLAAWNGNADALVRAVASSGACAGLRAFHITNGTGGAEAPREAQFWPTLEELGLDGPMLSGGGAERLAGAPAAPHLRRVSLTGTSAGLAGLRALASSPLFASLDRLDLRFSSLGPEGGEALAAMPAAPLLLNLAGCDIGDEGLTTLAGWPGLARCRELILPNNRITDEGASALAASPHAAGLVGLNLYRNQIRDAGAARLLAADWAGRLAMLLLGQNQLTQALFPHIQAGRLGAMQELGLGVGPLPVRVRHALASIPDLS